MKRRLFIPGSVALSLAAMPWGCTEAMNLIKPQEPKRELTKHDIEAIEKARAKWERKAAHKAKSK